MAKRHIRQFVLDTPSGAPVRGDIRWSEPSILPSVKRPVVIVCHGFKAFKDWGPFPAIGEYFAANGFVSIVINFSHNGIGEAPRKFVDHERFANNTVSIEIGDLTAVIDEISSTAFGIPFIDASRIALVGHSRGGGVALITARTDSRVAAVAAWGTIAHFDRYTEEQRLRWREKGFVQLHSVSDQRLFRISTKLLDDLEQNAEQLNILAAVASLQKPLLIVHGSEDIPVKLSEARRLYDVSDKTLTTFVTIDGTGHMFGAKHPYTVESPSLNKVLNVTSDWLLKHLLSEV